VPISFPALRGIFGDSEYFSAILTFGEAARLIEFVEDVDDWLPETDARTKSQRRINQARVERELVPYLTGEPDRFFGAVVVEIRPLPGRLASQTYTVEEDLGGGLARGRLALDGTATLVALDGQHRLRAVQLALREVPTLASDHIAVVFVPFRSIRRSQLLFADLNRFARVPPRSLTLLFSHRDPIVAVANALIAKVPLLEDRVEFESTSLARYSPKFVTFSALYEMTRTLLGAVPHNRRADLIRETDRLTAVWLALSEQIEPWRQLATGREHAAYLRADSLAMHGVGQQAIARVVAGPPAIPSISELSSVDWSLANSAWQGLAVQGRRVTNTPASISLLTSAIRFEVGVPLDRASAENLATLIRARGEPPPEALLFLTRSEEEMTT
jgi:DNA sulfur modification protein DndB